WILVVEVAGPHNGATRSALRPWHGTAAPTAGAGVRGMRCGRECRAVANRARRSEMELGAQSEGFRIAQHAGTAGIGQHIVGLQLEVAAEVPVRAEGPVRLATARD